MLEKEPKAVIEPAEQVSNPKRPSKLLLFSGIAVLFIFLLWFAYFLGQQSVKQTPIQASPIVQSTPAASQVSQTDEMSDWKTYANSKYSFSYPSSWEIIEEHNPIMQAPFYGSKTSDTVKVYSDNSYIRFFSGVVTDYTNPNAKFLTKQNIEISGKKAIKATFSLSNLREEAFLIEVKFEEADPYKIEAQVVISTQEVFDQILSTFRFVE